MIYEKIYGTPLAAFAVPEENFEACGAEEYFRVEESESGIRFVRELEDGAPVYGLGETMRGINKRGGRYVSYNTDCPNHQENMKSLYAAHNFVIIDGSRPVGAFFDTPARVTFRVDTDGSGILDVMCETHDMRLFVITGEKPYDIARQFLKIIGRPFLPPLWAFGFGQSRWGYKNEADFRRVADGYRSNGIPLDYICMDIDYMDRYIDFTVNKKRFPDMKRFVGEMLSQNIHLVPIVDAGVKVEPGNRTYSEGVRNGYFCTNERGGNFRAAVWPGMTHFPDFFQPEARAWFGSCYKALTDLGFEGFWNDMNEPAIFYSEYNAGPGRIVNMLIDAVAPAKAEKEAEKAGEPGAYRDYRRFFHRIDGRYVCHHEVHNQFGAYMTVAGSEGLAKLIDHRFLLFSRSSYIGAHRYGGIWFGDNRSDWALLRTNVKQMPNVNMCGFLYCGADCGGFGGNCTKELLLRWLAFSAWTPLMRDHTARGTKNQEAYVFGDADAFARIIGFRYRILPYLYSEFMKAALTGDLLFRPLAFDYPDDPEAKLVEDELMMGESVLIAPVVEEGAPGRNVYLPEAMTEIRYSGGEFTQTEVPAGKREIPVALDEIVFYIKKGKAVPIAKPAQCTSEADLEDVTLLGDGDGYLQYLDDGLTRDCSMESVRFVKIN